MLLHRGCYVTNLYLRLAGAMEWNKSAQDVSIKILCSNQKSNKY